MHSDDNRPARPVSRRAARRVAKVRPAPAGAARGRRRAAVAAPLAALALAASPAAAQSVTSHAHVVAAAPASASPAGASGSTGPDTVTQWNLAMLAGLAAAGTKPQPANRIAAIVQASVFDAVNGIGPRYTPYHVAPAAPAGSSKDAAAAGAAYAALVALLPAQKPLFDAQLSSTLSQISDDPAQPGPAVERGLSWGHTVAGDILAWRANDGIDAVLPPYVPGTAPGDWQPTPPLFNGPLFRQFATMTPFALKSPSQFLPPPPPSLTSPEWVQALAEVRALGSATSTIRTPWQTQTAIFWQSDTDVAVWDRVADHLAQAHDLPLVENARRLALVDIALADATIAVFNAKNAYNFWRPITAITSTSDPTWRPLMPTPAFQEYPASHTALSGAAATVLASFYGDATSFSLTAAGLPGVTRSFDSFSAAVQQVEDARVFAGFHYRFSSVVGAELGAKVGNYIISNLMRRDQ